MLVLALFALAACGTDDEPESESGAAATPAVTSAAAATTVKPSGTITLYSGRSESLVAPLIERFQKDTGITVNVKYAGTTELASLLLEEGNASPADVFFSQDGGALGAVSKQFDALPESVLGKVDAPYRAENGTWVATSARARVIAYNTGLDQSSLPNSYADLTDPKWRGKIGWAPTNASFHTFVTLLREMKGEAAAEQWLKDMTANGVRTYPGNAQIVSAVASGEIQLGLVNHYYLWGFVKDQGDGFAARNHYTAAGDPASLVNVAGAGVLKTSKNKPAALALLDYMLSENGQKFFADQTYEYPVVKGIAADPRLKPLDQINPPAVDLSKLDDLEGTLDLLRKVKVLQ